MDATKNPLTLEEWAAFMNGYRDPKSREAQKLAALNERGFNDDYDFYSRFNGGGGAMENGGEEARECGFRKEGGVYGCVPLGANGLPLEAFIVCKPTAIDKEEYGITPLGVTLVSVATGKPCPFCKGEGGGIADLKPAQSVENWSCSKCEGTGAEKITHVFDIVGRDNYPNIADFIEEARRLGVSRRLELENAFQYSRLDSRSRLVLLHERAVITNPDKLFNAMEETESLRFIRGGCPKGLALHHYSYNEDLGVEHPDFNAFIAPGCAALHYHVIEGGELIPENVVNQFDITNEAEKPTRFINKKLVSGSYRGYMPPAEVEIEYSLGIFAIFPLARIEVVDPNGEYEDKVAKATGAGVDVLVTEC